MRYYNIYSHYSLQKPVMLLIGYFDAMHKGHIRIINDLISYAGEYDILPMILTFDTVSVKPCSSKHVLPVKERLLRMRDLGINRVIMCNFDKDIRFMPAEKFVSLLKNNFNVKALLAGPDLRFGRGRTGDESLLLNAGIEVIRSAPLMLDDGSAKISTNRIKQLIADGDIENANSMLGRHFSIPGTVCKGKQLGRTLGFPTMNITNPDVIYPADGAYITQTHAKGQIYQSMTFVSPQIVETHLIGYEKFSYNLQINIDFFKKIRDNMTFQNSDELKAQLSNDLAFMRRYFEINKLK